MDIHNKQNKIPLFRDYPGLEERLPYVSLSTLPTPIEEMPQIADDIGIKRLFIKRDDLSGEVYGGNKVRKLEFLLGDILCGNAKEVITFGFAGSNHALATAIYAKKLGLKCTSMLMSQVNAHYLRQNLLAGHHYNSRLCHYRNLHFLSLDILPQILRSIIKHGAFPRFIPAGGSCPLGITGYVNAAFELKDQITAGKMQEPDLIYVPLGSMGTSAGLMLGLKALGLKTKVIPIRVIEEKMASPRRMLRLIRNTISMIRKIEPDFPNVRIFKNDLHVRNEFMGEGYAHFTKKAVDASDLMKRKKGITMNGAYSAKAFSALLDDAGKDALNNKIVLFWNTYNSRNLDEMTNNIDFHQLPKNFHRYFDEDVQELDRE